MVRCISGVWMMAFSILLKTFVLLFLAVVALDRLVPRALGWLAPILPDDLAGPGGWLRDTHKETGIFDRPSGR